MRESGVLYKHARLKKLVALTTIQPSSPSGIPDMLASKEREQVEQEDTVEQAENDKAPGKHGIEMESLRPVTQPCGQHLQCVSAGTRRSSAYQSSGRNKKTFSC